MDLDCFLRDLTLRLLSSPADRKRPARSNSMITRIEGDDGDQGSRHGGESWGFVYQSVGTGGHCRNGRVIRVAARSSESGRPEMGRPDGVIGRTDFAGFAPPHPAFGRPLPVGARWKKPGLLASRQGTSRPNGEDG